ncbi:hypothetical protein AGMMS49579_08560 [Spirochaetia bacterium]|nr:hypothetical protein AGMMS49579_08560 [Spirochaetia bacterium]
MKGKIDRAVRQTAPRLRTSRPRRLRPGHPVREQSRKRTFRPADFIVALLCLAGILFFLWLFWLDYNRTLTRMNALPVGTITWKYKAAQRRFVDRSIWGQLQKESSLYNGDYIRTAKQSEATVTFTGGAAISLTEDSMIQILVDDEEPQAELLAGAVSVDNTEGENDFLLNAGGQTIRVPKGTAMDFRIGENGAQNDAHTIMHSPKPLARLINRTSSALPVEFAWEGVNYAGGDRTRLEIAEDRAFKRIVRTQNGDTQGSALITLAPGVWYWRAYPAGLDTAAHAAAAVINKLTILSAPPTQILSPEDGYEYHYRSKLPAVRFQWTSSPDAAFYILEAADNPGFLNAALRKTVQGGPGTSLSLTHSGLGNGRWYWRVRPVMDAEDGTPEPGASASFTITQSGELAVPALRSPEAEAIISIADPPKDIYFSWGHEAEAASYTLLVSREADLRNPLITQQVTANYYAYNAIPPLVEGRYYWGVYQTGLDGKISGTSPSRPFTIQQWEPVLRPTFPQDKYTTTAAALRDTRFTWKTNQNIPLRFQVSATPDFARLVVDEAVAGSFTGLSLEEGQWYWRVAAETGSLRTAAMSLRVRQGLAAPERLAPVGPITVQANTATAFTWQDVDGADTYTLNLYTGNRSTGTPLRNIPYIKGSQVEIPLDQDGAYTWTLQAFANERTGSTRLSSPLANAAFTVNASTATPAPAAPTVLPVALLPEAGNRRPVNGYTGVAQLQADRTITFSWNTVPGANRYIFTLYREAAEGRQLVRRWEPSRQNSLVLDDLSILGNSIFIWQVEAVRVGANDTIEQRGTPGENRFTVNTSTPAAPTVLPVALLPEPGNRRPVNGYTLGVAQLRADRTIAFSWNTVPGANRYIVTLYREAAGGRQLVRRWEPSRQNSLVLDDLSILGNSGFIWQVEAVRVGADDAIEQRGTPGENRFTVNLPPLPRDTLKSPGRVYGQ